MKLLDIFKRVKDSNKNRISCEDILSQLEKQGGIRLNDKIVILYTTQLRIVINNVDNYINFTVIEEDTGTIIYGTTIHIWKFYSNDECVKYIKGMISTIEEVVECS